MARIVTQLSVHVENRPGALAELTETLVGAGINIEAIAVPDSGEFGTIRVLVDDVMEARETLREAGCPHTAVDVLAVRLPHRPGALAQVARLLADGNVVIRYAWATNIEGTEAATCILCVDDIHKAQGVLDTKLTD